MIDSNNLPALIGATVLDSDGNRVGTLAQIYVNPETREPSWIGVTTGLFGKRQTFVPLAGADAIGDDVRVAFDKSFIKHAPNVDPDGALSVDDETKLYDYYSPSPDTGSDTGTGSDEKSHRPRLHKHVAEEPVSRDDH